MWKTILNGLGLKINSKADKKDIVQSDWNQNDENAKDYVKNRTHWEERNITEILPLTTLEFTSAGYDGGLTVDPLNLVPGEIYTVLWDGQEYLSEGLIYAGICYIGNLGFIGGPGKEEPFLILDDGFYASATVGTHTVAIYKSESVTHKIDPKFLPDDIGVQSDWNQNDETAKDYIKNKPFGVGEFVYTPEQSVTFEDNGHAYPKGNNGVYFQHNETVKLIFDGEEYVTVTTVQEVDDVVEVTLSNGYSLTAWNPDHLYCPGIANGEVHTVKIVSLDREGVNRIDPKYMPETYVFRKSEYVVNPDLYDRVAKALDNIYYGYNIPDVFVKVNDTLFKCTSFAYVDRNMYGWDVCGMDVCYLYFFSSSMETNINIGHFYLCRTKEDYTTIDNKNMA